MSDKKHGNPNNAQTKNMDHNCSHSDSDNPIDDQRVTSVTKSERKKAVTTNFGRPRKYPYKPGKYKCSYCEIMCSKPSVLTKHMRAHTNERPFPCSVCKRSFKTKSNLSKHEKSKSHSSKVGETQSKQFKREKMLPALPNLENSGGHRMNSIEFDGIPPKAPVSESIEYSPSSIDDKSVISDEIGACDSVKKEKTNEVNQDSVGDLSEITESSSSCSGVLTINSQGGPITVEVQINLETMRHLQQGLSNITNKRNSPSSPIQPIVSRNDAELRAAESILHMANQRPIFTDNYLHKEDPKRNGTAFRRLPGTLSPMSRNSPDPSAVYKPISQPNILTKSSPTKDKLLPIEEPEPLKSKKETKVLVIENLLKKMKRKQGQDVNDSATNRNGPHHNKFTESGHINPKNLMLRPINNPSKILNYDSLSNSMLPDTDKPPVKVKPGILFQKTPILPSNPQIINCIANTCNSPTLVLLSPANNSPGTLTPDSKPNSSIDAETATLSKVITNTQSLHQHQGPRQPNADNLPATNIITTARVAVSASCLEPITDLSNTIQLDKALEKLPPQLLMSSHYVDADGSDASPNQQTNNAIQAAQESESDSSPRLLIVEETVNTMNNLDKKSSESDEEIDVVNTDSDDDRLSLQRTSEMIYSDGAAKKRTRSCDDDCDPLQKDIKRLKEVEKIVPLHAPNINAKDLMQDCPLNLSANRQPTIPSVSSLSANVLQNLYHTISPSSVSISSLTNSNNTYESDSHISVLTNHNPAHPQSFQTFPTATPPFQSNGASRHLDYPIFEDKVVCDVCSQMIEPSMLNLHKNLHIFTDSTPAKDSHGSHHSKSAGSSSSTVSLSSDLSRLPNSKIAFNKPRSYKCVVCDTAFRVVGHLHKHHKSKSHLLGLVNSGLLSKTLHSKIEQSKVPIPEVIDQKTGNIIPDVLSRYISNWSQASTDCDPH